MTINNRFNIGDTVWFLSGDMPTQGVVVNIIVICFSQDKIDMRYVVGDTSVSISDSKGIYFEWELFKSREVLIEFL